MAINLLDKEVMLDPIAGESYVWRVSNVFSVQSKNSGNVYLSVEAEIVEGPSAGFSARFPAYTFMLIDAENTKTAMWIRRSVSLMAFIIGVSIKEIPDIPNEEGEYTESMKMLLNSMFEAEAVWQEPRGEYEGSWAIGNVQAHVDPEDVVQPDWASFSNVSVQSLV